MDKLLNNILNKKEEPMFNIATVTSLDPFTVKFPPDTTSIPCIATNNLQGIAVNSRVVVIRYKKQFIATSVIQASPYPIGSYWLSEKTGDDSRSTTTVSADPDLTLTLPKNGLYLIDVELYIDGVDSGTDFKLKWTSSNLTAISRGVWSIGTTTTSTTDGTLYPFFFNFSAEAATGVISAGWILRKERLWCSTDSSNDGTLYPEWSANTSTGNNVTLKSYSKMLATKIDNN